MVAQRGALLAAGVCVRVTWTVSSLELEELVWGGYLTFPPPNASSYFLERGGAAGRIRTRSHPRGRKPPASFFGWASASTLACGPDCAFECARVRNAEDGVQCMEWLAFRIGRSAPFASELRAPRAPTLPAGEPLTATAIGRAVGALVPEGVIFSDETVSCNEQIRPHLAGAPAHDHLPVTGGSIGQGLPVALGAVLACPGRKVVALEADGSAMYTLQSLWTMARERLDVTIVILANRRYRILDVEMRRTGAGAVGPRADRMLDLTDPQPDWIKLSEGFGVPAVRTTTADEFIREFGTAMKESGPRLIEAVLEQGWTYSRPRIEFLAQNRNHVVTGLASGLVPAHAVADSSAVTLISLRNSALQLGYAVVDSSIVVSALKICVRAL